jgi:hypothetical protein
MAFTEDNAKSKIIELVSLHNGLTDNHLLRFMSLQLQLELVPNHLHKNYNFKKMIQELVDKGLLVELLYFNKMKPEDKHSFYMPQHTSAIIIIT